MKSRRIDLGLLYIALLILVIVSIPLIQVLGRQTLDQRRWAVQSITIEKSRL